MAVVLRLRIMEVVLRIRIMEMLEKEMLEKEIKEKINLYEKKKNTWSGKSLQEIRDDIQDLIEKSQDTNELLSNNFESSSYTR